MKKTMFILALVAACLMVLSGCLRSDPAAAPTVDPTASAAPSPAETGSHEHSWQDATCSAPKTCAECGLTEGDPLEHTFSDWYPDQNKQYRTCQICSYQETKGLDLDDYYDTAFTMLSSGWDLATFPDEFTGVSANTKNALSLNFTVANGTLSLNNTPIHTFEWALKSVSGWSLEDSTAGLTIDLNTTLDGKTIVLDGQEFTVKSLTLSVVTQDPSHLLRPTLNMLISSNETTKYVGFATRSASVSDPGTYLNQVIASLSREWNYGYLPNEHFFISEKSLNDLSMTFEGTTGTFLFDDAPIYTFTWKLDSVEPWGYGASQGYWANLSLSSAESKLVLEEKEIILQNISFSVVTAADDGNYNPVVNLFVTVDGRSEAITFYMDTDTYNLEGYQEMTEKALSGSWTAVFHPQIEHPLSQNTLEHLRIHFDGVKGMLFYDGEEVYTFEWALDDAYPHVSPWFSCPFPLRMIRWSWKKSSLSSRKCPFLSTNPIRF